MRTKMRAWSETLSQTTFESASADGRTSQSPAALAVDRRWSAMPWSRPSGSTTIVFAIALTLDVLKIVPHASAGHSDVASGHDSAFQHQDVGKPLVMGPRCIDGLRWDLGRTRAG